MRRIVDVTVPANEGGATSEHEWWKRVSKSGFGARIETMDLRALERLRAELSGALSVIQSQLETRPRGDDDWYQRARRSLGYISQRNGMVKAVINTHNERTRTENEGRRTVYIADARSRLESGDVTGAVAVVLDLLEGQHARGK